MDITHPAGVNFFKNALQRLMRQEMVDVSLIVQPRGKLIPILENECPGVTYVSIGKYRTTLAGKGGALLGRCWHLLRELHGEHVDVLANFDDLGLSYVSHLLRTPLVTFEDDVENFLGFRRYRYFPYRIVLPDHLPVDGKNIRKYRGFKELAYLHPNHFSPQRKALQRYGLQHSEFVFIREVSSGSADYRHLMMGQLSKICPYLRSLGLKIVLSLEEKSLEERFRDGCVVLREPVEDIFSLLSYATMTVSSGDSMARESCLLGTPAVYTGGREMAINSELENRGCLFRAEGEGKILETIRWIIDNKVKEHTKEAIAHAIYHEWEDTTQVIIDNLLEVAHHASHKADR